ncbi:Na+/H+ antiporter NhaC family protein [uncultured Tessaracoccus sp.]|uniref:Na+/H+ antiporter NhaC family protein n=1 Tax=uncultured Tessaracoccus sp. TaxID=905023 RepID=UPI00261DDD0E|nr:Na+/H+ antiporter NhaC family protein [uncultured Tessaracoccus sp.]
MSMHETAKVDERTLPTDDKDTQAGDSEDSNAYGVELSKGRQTLLWVLAAIGIGLSLYAGFTTGEGPTLWGLLPIILYAVLSLLGMDIVVATVIAIASGVTIAGLGPAEIGKVLGDSMADLITVIGLIIMLGAGVGEILKVTGVAKTIVRGVMRVFGDKRRWAIAYGIMTSCVVLVASLGTLAGAIAIASPILLPIAARMKFTKSATAMMMFIGGASGLAVAPFAGSNVAIMEAANVSYLQYLQYGAGPIAILSMLLGYPVVLFIQRLSAKHDDYYTDAEIGLADDVEIPKNAGRSTAVFLLALVASVVYATWMEAGTTFPLLALPFLGLVTGLAGGLGLTDILKHFYKGCASLVSIFILFWMLAALFIMIDTLAPFDVILETYGEGLASGSRFLFTILIALLGWVGIPGATAAQVVLLNEVFGPLATTMGVSAGAWVVVLLFASKADTYGPFPNGNMIGVMGMARSKNLRNMLIGGWLLLIPATILYAAILFVEAM